MAMGSGKAIRNLAHDLLNKHECEILKAALKHFRATKSVPFLCTSLMQVINTPEKMVLLEEISNMLPESLRGDFTNICSMNFKDYTNEKGLNGDEKNIIAQDATGQYMVVESDHRKDLIKPGDVKSNITGDDLKLQAPPKPKKGSESGSTDTLQDENQNSPDKNIDKQKQRLTLPLSKEDGTNTPSSVGTCRTEDLNDYVDKHLGVIYEREFEMSPLPGEVTSSTDIGEMYGLQKKDSSLPRKKKVKKDGEGVEKSGKVKGRRMPRQDSGDSSTTGASKPLSRPQSRGSLLSTGHSSKGLKKKASKISLDSRESLDSRDQYLMEVQSKNNDNVVGTVELNSFLRSGQALDALPHEASDKSIQVLLDPTADPRNLRCESTQTSPSISRENSMLTLSTGKGRRKAHSGQSKGDRAASAPPCERPEKGAKATKKAKDKSQPNNPKSGSRPPSATMTRSSSMAHSISGRTGMEIRKVKLTRQESSDLGFSIRGGRDVRSGVYISEVDNGGQAEKKGLLIGDRILKVNDTSFRSITHDEAAYTIKTSGRIVMFVTSSLMHKMPIRSAPPSMKGQRAIENLKSMTVKADPDGWLGCSIRGGTDYGMSPMVSNVDVGSPAEKVGLKNGDLVVRMNGVDVTALTHMQIVTLATSSRELRLLIKPIEQPQQQDEAREPLEDLSGHESTPTPTLQMHQETPSPIARKAPAQLPVPEKTDTGKSPRGKRKQKKSDKKYASTDAIHMHHQNHPDLAIAKNDENEPPSIRLVNATPLIDGHAHSKPTEEGGAAKNKEHEEERKKEKRKSRSRQNLVPDEKGEKHEKESTQGDMIKKRDRLKPDGDDDAKTRSLDRRKLRKEREEKKSKRDGTKSLDRKEMEHISQEMKEEKKNEMEKRRESKEEKRRERKLEKEKAAEESKQKEAADKVKESKEAEPGTKPGHSKQHEVIKSPERSSKEKPEHQRKKSIECIHAETFDEPMSKDGDLSDRSTPVPPMKQEEHHKDVKAKSSPVEKKRSPEEHKKSPVTAEQNEHTAKERKPPTPVIENKNAIENEPVHKKDDHKKGKKEQKLNETNLEKNENLAEKVPTRTHSREERQDQVSHREQEMHHRQNNHADSDKHHEKVSENHHDQKHHDKKKNKHEKHSEKIHREKSHEQPHLKDDTTVEKLLRDLSPKKPEQPLEIKEEEIQMSVVSEVANGNSGEQHHNRRGRKERQSSREERESRKKKTPTSEVDSGLPPSIEDLADVNHKLIRRMTHEDSWSDNNASFDREDFVPGSLNRKRRTSVSSQTTQSTQTDISGEIKVTKVMSGTIRMNLDQQQSLDDPTKMVLSPKEHVKNIFPMDSASKLSDYDHLHHDEGAQTYMYGSIEGINEMNQDSASLEDAPQQRSVRHAPYKKLSRAGSDASLMKKKQHGVSLKHKAPSVSNLMLESSPGIRQRASRYDDYNIMDYPPQIRDLRMMDYYEPRVRSLPRGMPGISRRDGTHTLPRDYSFTRGIQDDYEERYYMTREPHSAYSMSSAKDHSEVRAKLPRDVHSEYCIRTAREEYVPDQEHAWYDDNLESNWQIPLEKEKNLPHDLRGYDSDHLTRRCRDDSGSRSISGERIESRRYCDRDNDPMRKGYYQEKEYHRSYPDQEYARRSHFERDNSRDRRDKYYDRDLPVKEGYTEKSRDYREKSQEREPERIHDPEDKKKREKDLEKSREQDFEERERKYIEYNREQELKRKSEKNVNEKGQDQQYHSKVHDRDYKHSMQDRNCPDKRLEGDYLHKGPERDFHEHNPDRVFSGKSHEQGYSDKSHAYIDNRRDPYSYSERDRHHYGPPGYRWHPDHDEPYNKRPEYTRKDSLPRENQYDRPYLSQTKRRERSFDMGIERERSFGAMSFGGYEHNEGKHERDYSPAYRPGYGERPLSNRSDPGYHSYQERIIPGRQGIYLPDPEQGPLPVPSANRPYLDPTFLRQPQRLAPPFNIEQTSLSRESLDHDAENENVGSNVNLSSTFGADQTQPQQPTGTKEKPALYQQTVGSLEGQGIRIQWKKPPKELEQFAFKGGPLPWHSQQQYSQDSDGSEKFGNIGYRGYNYSSFSEPKSSAKKFDSSSPLSMDRDEFQNSSELSFTQNPIDFNSGNNGANLLSDFRSNTTPHNVHNNEDSGNSLELLQHKENDLGAKNNKDNGYRLPMDEFDVMGDETDQMTISSLPPDDRCEEGSEQDMGLPTGGDAKQQMEPLEELVVVENSVGLSCEPSIDFPADLRPGKTSPNPRPPHMRQASEEEEWNM